MASPQTENGYIRIANELWDAVLQRDFSKRQKDLLLFIWRLSYGCQRKNAYVPKMKNFELCGVPETKVKTELVYLEKSRVLFWDRESRTFEINKDHENWFVSLVKAWDDDIFSELIAINLAKKTSQNGNENFPKREEKLPKMGIDSIDGNEETSQKGKNELPETGTSTADETSNDAASQSPKDIIKDIEEEEEEITAMEAYTKSFGKFMYTGFIQGYVRDLLKRGFKDSFIREVFLEMGSRGIGPNEQYMRKLAEDWIARGISTREQAHLANSTQTYSNVTPFPSKVSKQQAEIEDLRRKAREARELEQG